MGLKMPSGDSAATGRCACGSPIAETAGFCEKCGRSVRPLCGLCNAVLSDKAEFCAICGAPRTFSRPAQCPNCSIRLTAVGNFCPGCGQLLYRLCGTCGNRLVSGWLRCPACNRPSESQEPAGGLAENGAVATQAIPAVDGDSPMALAEILNQEGATAFEREQYDDAEQLFRRAVELDPEESLYRTNLAAVLSELDREEEADRELGKALEIDPDDPATLLAAGMFAANRDDLDTAAAHWNRLLEVAPDSPEAGDARGNLREIGWKE